MEILVFKTNVITPAQKKALHDLMSRIHLIGKWNLDVWDVDNILRVESVEDCSGQIIQKLTQAGLECSPLEE